MFWILLTYAAWAISAYLIFWMLFDAARVSKDYNEDILLSSREGADELLDAEHK